jgi:hypothetical protein
MTLATLKTIGRDLCKLAVGANLVLLALALMAGPRFESLVWLSLAAGALCAVGAWGKSE